MPSFMVGRLVIHQARDSARVVASSASGEQSILKNKYANISRNSWNPVILVKSLARYTRLEALKLPTPIPILVVHAEGYVDSAPTPDLQIDTGQRSAISRKFVQKHNGLLITT